VLEVAAIHEAVHELKAVGLVATPQVLTGKPSESLVAEAARWETDCLFVGARGLTGLKRFLLGSVSTAAALHVHCLVEVVRRQTS
jgi:nucleotide-binding universal stress UspA family protein